MDGQTLYPEGFHPSAQHLVPAANRLSKYIPRIYAPPVKYYFIDFDISVKFDKSSTGPRLTSGFFGQEKEVPELHIPEPYDPFALDVFILGKVFQKSFLDVRTLSDYLFFLQMTNAISFCKKKQLTTPEILEPQIPRPNGRRDDAERA